MSQRKTQNNESSLTHKQWWIVLFDKVLFPRLDFSYWCVCACACMVIGCKTCAFCVYKHRVFHCWFQPFPFSLTDIPSQPHESLTPHPSPAVLCPSLSLSALISISASGRVAMPTRAPSCAKGLPDCCCCCRHDASAVGASQEKSKEKKMEKKKSEIRPVDVSTKLRIKFAPTPPVQTLCAH